MNEATARIKINKLLESAGWRFFADGDAPANIRLEPSVTIKATDLDALGDTFERTAKGYIDFLLLDAKITEILRVVEEIESRSKPVIEQCYREFLLQNHDSEEREYPDVNDQIREVLIHGNYMSQEDLEFCRALDLAELRDQAEFPQIEELHQSLVAAYGDSSAAAA